MMLLPVRAAVLAAALNLALPVYAQTAAPEHETATMQFQHDLPGSPGRRLTAVLVSYPPGVKSTAHHHAQSAFIYARVLSGQIRSQVDDEPAKVYKAGESWYEAPGAYHKVSENASDTEPATLLAVFIVNTGEQLTIPDRK